MMRKTMGMIFWTMIFAALAGLAWAAQNEPPTDADASTIGRTPPRLSLIEGQVSFWRPGAEDWAQAELNTALAPGDQLFAGSDSRMEIQIGAKAFVRGGADTQLGLETQEPDFIRLKLISGQVSLDLRAMAAGRLVEVDTPNAAFTIDTEGYYRLDVGDTTTGFVARRAGRATVVTGAGEKIPIESNMAVTVEGSSAPSISARTAPPLDALDKWSYARTDRILENRESVRYVSGDIYGIDDLDRYGTWRVVPTYGAVWIPREVGHDWVPYSTGAWMHDPDYGWTWVDTAAWGWAPYHYGRWIRFNGYWCWAPGPRIVQPVYAPALVAFLGQPYVQVGIAIGGPLVGWVSLGWGEPLIPWWGRPGFKHRPWWGGWAGPRVVNNRIVHRTTVINVTKIKLYRNMRIHNAVIVVGRDHFGRGHIARAHLRPGDIQHLHPTHAAPLIARTPAGRVPTPRRGLRPPEAHLKRGVVSARRPVRQTVPGAGHIARGNAGRSHELTTRRARGVPPRPPQAGHDRNGRIAPRSPAATPRAGRAAHGSERRRAAPSPATRSAAPHPPRTSHPARPAAPRTPERPPGPTRHPDVHRPEQAAPRPAENRGRNARPLHAAPAKPSRIQSNSHALRSHDRGPNEQPSAIHSQPHRLQDPVRSAAPSRIFAQPPQRTRERSPEMQRNEAVRQNRPSKAFHPRNDSAISSRGFEQGRANRGHSRHGRDF